MTYRLDIPESIAASLKVPTREVAPRLRSGLALARYTAKAPFPPGSPSPNWLHSGGLPGITVRKSWRKT
jgi:hypothetical protein